MKYSIYNLNTGEITDLATFADQQSVVDNLADKHYVEGHYDPSIHYIKNGQICQRQSNPSTDQMFYQFDIDSEQWTLILDLRSQIVRTQRDEMLSMIDRVNPVWFNSLTQIQQTELAQYRQALLDVPQQTGFPVDITWPSKPLWL